MTKMMRMDPRLKKIYIFGRFGYQSRLVRMAIKHPGPWITKLMDKLHKELMDALSNRPEGSVFEVRLCFIAHVRAYFAFFRYPSNQEAGSFEFV